MATQNPKPQPNPVGIFQAINAYQLSMALKSAIELELFTHIAGGAVTAAELAKRTQASEKGIRILSDFLTVTGFLTKIDSTYGLTPDTALFLNKQSPAYMGAAVRFLAGPDQLNYFADLTSAVRKGSTVRGEGTMEADNDIWIEFARSMGPISAGGAIAVAALAAPTGGALKVLDIAAGPGLYGIEIAKRNPQAEIYGVDWKNVLTVASEHAQKHGVADRYHTIPGSAFEVDLGSGYDLVLLPNFLHHFDHPTNVKLLKRLHAALKPGGRLATVEFVPNADRVSPPAAATFSIIMLTNTDGGDAYTLPELTAMFKDAGFGESAAHEIPPSPELLILTARP